MNAQKFISFLESSVRFAVRREGQTILIVHDFAMFRSTVEALPSRMCPERDGIYIYYDEMVTFRKDFQVLRPAPEIPHFALWRRACQADAVSSLELSNQLWRPARGEAYCQLTDAAGAVHLLGTYLTDTLSTSVGQLKKTYRFEALTGHRVRIFRHDDPAPPIALFMECVKDQPADPLGLKALFLEAMGAEVRRRAEESRKRDLEEGWEV